MKKQKKQKPIYLYDHTPEVLAAMPALVLLFLALNALPEQLGANWKFVLPAASAFWFAAWAVIFWFIAMRWNLPKRRFFLVFGLVGTFIGIPIALELVGKISFFRWLFDLVGLASPWANAGAYLMFGLGFAILFMIDFVWSRTHLKVLMTGSDITIYRTGGKTESFELLGLKHETEPLDYAEVLIGGFGSISIALRSGRTLFSMNRVFRLYRLPWFPFVPGKREKIEQLLRGAQVRIDNTMSPQEKRRRMELMEADEGAIGEEDPKSPDDEDRLGEPAGSELGGDSASEQSFDSDRPNPDFK